MIVRLIGHTVIDKEAIEEMGYVFHEDGTIEPGDELAEVAGRECYQAWNRPNPATATNRGYLGNILHKQHFSILEHASCTFSVRNVSRALTHELVRHRHLSFSMISQRYVDESDGEFVLPLEISRNKNIEADHLMTDTHLEQLNIYEKVFHSLTEAGVPRKRARQAARYVLPNGHATRLVVSGNIRAWREFLSKRLARDAVSDEPLADLEIHELATRILEILHTIVPHSVQDLWLVHTKNKPVTN